MGKNETPADSGWPNGAAPFLAHFNTSSKTRGLPGAGAKESLNQYEGKYQAFKNPT